MLAFVRLRIALLAAIFLQTQVVADDINVLLFDAQGRAAANYNSIDVAEQLNSILVSAEGFEQSSARRDTAGGSTLLDSWYNTNHSDGTRQELDSDCDVVVMFPRSFVSRKVPETEFEALRAMGNYVLNNGDIPLFVMDAPATSELHLVVESAYRAANGAGIDVVPAGLAVEAAGLLKPSEGLNKTRQTYLTAATIFSQITGLNAYDASDYVPMYESSPIDGSNLAAIAQAVLASEETAVHYTGDSSTSGAIVYRPLDATQPPFNGNVRFIYKGTSTETGMHSYLNTVIQAQGLTPLGIRVTGGGSLSTWKTVDTANASPEMAPYPDEFVFMYTRRTTVEAHTLTDLNQANLLPIDYDRHSMAIGSGTESTSNMSHLIEVNEIHTGLNHDSYDFQGVMFNIAVARFLKADPTVVGSYDGTHLSPAMYHMMVSMIVSSALGTEPTPPSAVLANEQYLTGFNIGHRVIKELAFMSEDARYVPDTALRVTTAELPVAVSGVEMNVALSAVRGTPPYTWEEISDHGLPAGLSLSPDGVLSGIPAELPGTFNLVFKVTDSEHAIRKRALRLRVEIVVNSTGSVHH